MFVMARVAFTLYGAQAADFRAGAQHRAYRGAVRPPAPRADGAGRGANIRTIEIEPNAFAQSLELVLIKTCPGAGETGLAAVETQFDTAGQRLVFLALQHGA